MRKTGLWHPRLAALVAGLGHTETIVVADAGLPVPPGVEVVQLAVTRGVPAFLPCWRRSPASSWSRRPPWPRS